MAGLQRSAVSFRRQGSSGVVWDDRFFSGELKPTKRHDQSPDDAVLRPSRSVGSASPFQRSRSSAHRSRMAVISPSPPPSAGDPASPKFPGCGFCGVFGRPTGGDRHQKSNKHRSE